MTTALLRPSDDLVTTFLAGKSPHTIRSYRTALSRFALFLGVPDADAPRTLFAMPPGEANQVVLRFRNDLIEEGAASATVNARLAAVRALVKLARLVGMVVWDLHVVGLPVRAYRDTRGPPRHLYMEALGRASVRDAAILRLLGDRGLRRGEVSSLTTADVEAGAVWVLGKGRRERERLTLAPATAAAVAAWREEREQDNPGPAPVSVFGLSPDGIARVTRAAGLGHPHGLRHLAVTTALAVTHGDVRACQRFARHANPATTMLYDDDRADTGGRVAELVAG